MLTRRFLAVALLATALAGFSMVPLPVGNAIFTSSAHAGESRMAERPVPVIRVAGEGSAVLVPDLAIVTLGVMREGDTARAALDAHKKVMADVTEAMKAFKIAPRDLQTANFSIQPRYVYPNPKANGEQEPPRIVGYTVTSQLVVRIRDVGSIGDVLDQAVTLGVNSDGSIQFTNDNPVDAIAKARAAAMKDALQRARTLAEAAGVRVGAVQEISESFSQPQPMPITRGKMMLDASAEGVPVEAGENAYSVNVQAVFEIEQ